MKIYQPNFELYINRIKELIEYREKSKSRVIKAYINRLIDLTSHSLNVHEGISDRFYPQMISNYRSTVEKLEMIVELQKNKLPDDYDKIDESSQRILDEPQFSKEEKDRVSKNIEFLKKTKRENDQMIDRITKDVGHLVFLEKSLDNQIYNVFLDKTTRPLFENIYKPNLRKVDNQISYNLMLSLVKYGIEKLGISGKAEAELVNEIWSTVNRKKFIIDNIEKADFVMTEIFEPYEESILTWIYTNETILNYMKKLD